MQFRLISAITRFLFCNRFSFASSVLITLRFISLILSIMSMLKPEFLIKLDGNNESILFEYLSKLDKLPLSALCSSL